MNLDFLIEMGWKSALIAGAALTLATLMRSRAAADRAAILQLAVGLLLATPVIALVLPALEIETPPAATSAPPPRAIHLADPMVQAPEMPASVAPRAELPEAQAWTLPEIGQALLILYVLGVALVLARLLAGILTLQGWARRAEPVLSSEWTDALARAAAPGRPFPACSSRRRHRHR